MTTSFPLSLTISKNDCHFEFLKKIVGSAQQRSVDGKILYSRSGVSLPSPSGVAGPFCLSGHYFCILRPAYLSWKALFSKDFFVVGLLLQSWLHDF